MSYVLTNRSLSAGLIAATLLAACAVTPSDSDGWRDSQTPVLKSRVEARWNHLIQGEVEKAYTYLSPEYRSVVTLQQYRGKYGRAVEWRVAHADHVSYDSPTVASVSVEVTYRVGLPGARGEVVESKKILTEKWLYKDGGWWYTAK